MKKRYKKLTVLFTILLSAFIASACAFMISCAGTDGKDGADGKDGINGTDGKNAVIEVSDDGFILVNGTKTEYRFNKKDCKIKIAAINGRYGKTTGEGSYAYGTAVMLNATPEPGGVFVCWKNADGDVISTQNDLLAVADRGENTYTAVFACAPENVTARINVKFDESTLKNAEYTGDAETPLLNGATLKFSNYGENALVLYAVDAQTFEKESAKLNEDISNGALTGGKIIAYEHLVTLFNKKDVYYSEICDFYFYVAGRPNSRYDIKISASHKSGKITLSTGGEVQAEQNCLAGTVIKLKAQPESEVINGRTFEISDFSGWIVNGKKVSDKRNLVYTVEEKAEITAEFIPKTKLTLTIKSGEAGLTAWRYAEFDMPAKASGSINGKSFEKDISFVSGAATLDLGYYTAGETFSLELKLHCPQPSKFPLFPDEDTWRFVHLSYEYASAKIGEGNSLVFFVPESNDNKSEIGVYFVRTCNYCSDAVNETGENAKEILRESGYGLI